MALKNKVATNISASSTIIHALSMNSYLLACPAKNCDITLGNNTKIYGNKNDIGKDPKNNKIFKLPKPYAA
jgi:hypothetical protein